jgi:hypothetical protein
MKKLLPFQIIAALLFGMFFATTAPALSSDDEEISEGTEYWFGIPHCSKSSDESVRWGEFPIELWITSKVPTNFTIESADGTSLGQIKGQVSPGNVKIVKLPDNLMAKPEDNEQVRNKGIHIYSDEPISLGVFIAYMWSGEAFRIIPVEWLGNKYYTLNLYQDYVKMHAGYTEYKPCQILVCATEDGTKLKYKPTAETASGVLAGQTATVFLNKGETFLIESKIYPNLNQNNLTDLTGTYLEATKPISVISGHTKGAFPKYSASMYGIKADFMRNMLTDMMWPVELLGKEYVSAPLYFKNRTPLDVVPDDRGDIIRFVATEKNTYINQMRPDGTWKQISQALNPGQWFEITCQEQPAYYSANKPVLAGQYAKSWLTNLPNPIKAGEKVDDETLNPNRNGQGFLLVLAPFERWCKYATFHNADKMDAFVYVTFRTNDLSKLKFDGQYFIALFGAACKPIPGSPYSYVCVSVSTGDHIIEAEGDALFAGYAYGNWDYCKDGFAYGYPIGMNYASKCLDTITVTSEMVCGNVTATFTAKDLQTDTLCAQLYSITNRSSVCENYKFDNSNFQKGDKNCTFTLDVIDDSKPAHAEVIAMSRSGKKKTVVFDFKPETITTEPLTTLDFGVMQLGDSDCLVFTIKNNGDVPATINKLKLKNNVPEFVIQTVDFPVTLAPGATKEVTVCATPSVISDLPVEDWVIAELTCYETEIKKLYFQTNDPVVWISDQNWCPVPVNHKTAKTVQIINQSSAKVIFNEPPTFDDHVHFEIDYSTISFPLELAANATKEFTVWYTADEPDVTHSTVCYFTANTQKIKLYSNWTGCGQDVGPVITGYDWSKVRVIDAFAPPYYEGTIYISAVGNAPVLNITGIEILDNTDGVFEIITPIPDALSTTDEPIPLTIRFKPLEETEYIREIRIHTQFDGVNKDATAVLQGIGALPHVRINDIDYETPLPVGASTVGTTIITHLSRDPKYSWPLRITNLTIEGDDADCFAIEPSWLAAHPYPIDIDIDGTLPDIPVRFTANRVDDDGILTARLVIHDDAPLATDIDDHEALLTARAYSLDFVSTSHPFETIFITLERNAEVYFQNNSSIPITVTSDVTRLYGTQTDAFHIVSAVTSITNQNVSSNFELLPGERVTVTIKFNPLLEQSFDGYILYQSESQFGANPEYRSELTGIGKIYRADASMPHLTANPGKTVEFPFYLAKRGIEPDQLNVAKILHFRAEVTFKSVNTVNVQDVYPAVKSPSDIITQGTMTEGWECVSATISNDNMTLIVEMKQNDEMKPLAATSDNVLFKFNMNTFLSSTDTVKIPCKFIPIDVEGVDDNHPFEYVDMDDYPGTIVISPVCVNSMRLVEVGATPSIKQNNPNPVTSSTTIEYTVPYECYTKLVLVNSIGEVVQTLIDGVHPGGEYQITFSPADLGISSGTYFYRYESGSFSDTKTMVITK